MMKRIALGPLYYEFSRFNPIRERLQPGETAIVETEDAFSGQIRSDSDRRDKIRQPNSNPQTGPLWIEGAEPGDTLAVKIEDIQPLIGQCATRTGFVGSLAPWLGSDCPHGTHVCKIQDGLVHWSEKIAIPYAPMLGCIGVAPAEGVPTTLPAGPHGGNLDLVEVAPGNVVYLPIFVPGALLYLGDAHAAMGHGELSASGLEMPAATTLTVNLLKGKRLTAPRVDLPTEIMAVATGCPMERATAEAFARLILWMEEDFGWDRWRAYDLLTHTATMSIGYHAIGTVGVKIGKQYLSGG